MKPANTRLRIDCELSVSIHDLVRLQFPRSLIHLQKKRSIEVTCWRQVEQISFSRSSIDFVRAFYLLMKFTLDRCGEHDMTHCDHSLDARLCN